MENSWKVGQFTFDSEEEYKKAKNEWEQISKMIEGVDISKPATARKLYQMIRR